jgi:hypothetical protein
MAEQDRSADSAVAFEHLGRGHFDEAPRNVIELARRNRDRSVQIAQRGKPRSRDHPRAKLQPRFTLGSPAPVCAI